MVIGSTAACALVAVAASLPFHTVGTDMAQQLDRRIATAVEQRERQSRQADSKRDAIRQRMARLQETHDELMAERAGIEEKAAVRHRAIAAKEREVRSVHR